VKGWDRLSLIEAMPEDVKILNVDGCSKPTLIPSGRSGSNTVKYKNETIS
jgi:hypothetical protein